MIRKAGSISYHLSLITYHSSFVSESDHRVNFRGAARGDEAGQERDRREQQRDEDVCGRVGGADAPLRRPEDIRAYGAIRARFLGEARPASTLVVVPALVWPDMLIEIDTRTLKVARHFIVTKGKEMGIAGAPKVKAADAMTSVGIRDDSIGLCASCAYARNVESARGSRFILCSLSSTNPRFAKYPRLPVVQHLADRAPVAPLPQVSLLRT